MPPRPMSGAGTRQLQEMFKPRQVPERTAADDADHTAAAAAAAHAPSAARQVNPAAAAGTDGTSDNPAPGGKSATPAPTAPPLATPPPADSSDSAGGLLAPPPPAAAATATATPASVEEQAAAAATAAEQAKLATAAASKAEAAATAIATGEADDAAAAAAAATAAPAAADDGDSAPAAADDWDHGLPFAVPGSNPNRDKDTAQHLREPILRAPHIRPAAADDVTGRPPARDQRRLASPTTRRADIDERGHLRTGSGDTAPGWAAADDLADWRVSSISPDGPDPNHFSSTEYEEFTADRNACEAMRRGDSISTVHDQHRVDRQATETAPVRRSAASGSHGQASALPQRLARPEGMPYREASSDHRHSPDYDRRESQRRDERRQDPTLDSHTRRQTDPPFEPQAYYRAIADERRDTDPAGARDHARHSSTVFGNLQGQQVYSSSDRSRAGRSAGLAPPRSTVDLYSRSPPERDQRPPPVDRYELLNLSDLAAGMQVPETDLIDSGFSAAELQPDMVRILAGTSAAEGNPHHRQQLVHWRAELARANAASAAHPQISEAHADLQSRGGPKRPGPPLDHDDPGTDRRRLKYRDQDLGQSAGYSTAVAANTEVTQAALEHLMDIPLFVQMEDAAARKDTMELYHLMAPPPRHQHGGQTLRDYEILMPPVMHYLRTGKQGMTPTGASPELRRFHAFVAAFQGTMTLLAHGIIAHRLPPDSLYRSWAGFHGGASGSQAFANADLATVLSGLAYFSPSVEYMATKPLLADMASTDRRAALEVALKAFTALFPAFSGGDDHALVTALMRDEIALETYSANGLAFDSGGIGTIWTGILIPAISQFVADLHVLWAATDRSASIWSVNLLTRLQPHALRTSQKTAELYQQLEHTVTALHTLNRQGVPTRQLTRSELLRHSQATDPALRDMSEQIQALTKQISPSKQAPASRRKKAQAGRKGRRKKQAKVDKTGTTRQAGRQRGAKGGIKKAATGTAKATGAAKTAAQRGNQRGKNGSNQKAAASPTQAKGTAKRAASSSSDSDSGSDSDDSGSDSESDSSSDSDSAASAAPAKVTPLAAISLYNALRDFAGLIHRHNPPLAAKCLFAVSLGKPFGQPGGCTGQATSSGGRICHRCDAEQARRAKPKAAPETAAATAVAKNFFKLKSGRYVDTLQKVFEDEGSGLTIMKSLL